MSEQGEDILFCARCSRELQPGAGDFFEIRISAVADPYPPVLEDCDANELRKQIEQTLAQLSGTSSREAVESVAVQRVFQLCNLCYAQWIENPAG